MLRVNAYCKDWGWLFEDLKAELANVDLDGVKVLASDDPLPGCDAYIAIRTGEALASPAPSRTVVHWHDFRDHPAVWERLSEFGALQTVCPKQERPNIVTHCCPIGARSWFSMRDTMPDTYTLGWVGRDIVWQGRHIKRPELFVDLVRGMRVLGIDVQAHFYGPAFGAGNLARYVIECDGTLFDGGRGKSLEAFYHRIDALVVTCEPEPGPLTIYEAMRCGVPVISTETCAAGIAGMATFDAEELETVVYIRRNMREHHFRLRHFHRRQVEDLTQERWARFSVELAAGLAS